MSTAKTKLMGIVIAVIIVAALAYFALMPAAPKKEVVLIVGSTYDPQTLDPALAYDIGSAMVIQNIFDTLLTYEPGTTKLTGKLAESWSVSPDGTVWTFKLRDNVYFSDGTKLDAEAVKYSIERAIDLKGPPSFLLDVVDQVEVVDPLTVKIKLKEPYSPFASIMAFALTSVVSPKAAEELGEEFARKPIGSGPFILDSWVPGQEVVLKANENYWRGKPFVDKVIIKVIPDPSTLRLALEKGEVDMAFGIAPVDVAALKANPDVKMAAIESLVIEWLGFNVNVPPLDDKLVRKAISYAINYDYIVENITHGVAVRAYGPLPPGVWAYDPDIASYAYHYDPEKAKELLAQAGYPNGEGIPELELLISSEERPERLEVASFIASNLREIGINVRIKNVDWSTYLDALFAKNYTMHMVDWFPDYVDPDDWFYPLFYSENSLEGYGNEEVDRLILKARKTADIEERRQIYKQLQKLVVDDAPWVFLYVPKLYVFMRTNIEGFVLYPAYLIDFYPVQKT